MNIVQSKNDGYTGSDAYKLLLNVFVESTTRDLLSMYEAIGNDDREELSRLVLHIKGTAQSLEFNNFFSFAERIEQLLENGPLEAIVECHAGMCRDFNEVICRL